ncbi:hypothetical protein [Polyangium sp. y55x31]|uniref:hypothetical protein n=1 Tax=Polyangium sp. y55x31 TaxID=3042688 RepID=UPI002482801A|nr:hypothetical protein [Polyangium sp. y55x31]MDI1476871.1 hypothetical protein [Polyangium sp. y55x31]
MHLLTFAALIFVLVGCDRRPTEQRPSEAVTTTLNSTIVPAPARPGGEIVPVGDSKALFDQVVRALAALRKDRAAARKEFLKLANFCVGEAGLAYLAWDANEMAAAAAHLARAKALPGLCHVYDSSPLGASILIALRTGLDEAGHDYDSADATLPCEVFGAHPEEAFAASAPYWGSTRDLPALDAEFKCAEAAITSVVPVDQVPRTRMALKTAANAPLQVVHEPSGTMWISAGASVCGALARATIAPEVIKIFPDVDARISRGVAKAEARVRDIRKRLAAFEVVRATESPVLGDLICAVHARRNNDIPVQQCRRLASDVMKLALAQWLEAEPWSAIYIEGEP